MIEEIANEERKSVTYNQMSEHQSAENKKSEMTIIEPDPLSVRFGNDEEMIVDLEDLKQFMSQNDYMSDKEANIPDQSNESSDPIMRFLVPDPWVIKRY